jgi:hypothetical protein
MDIRYRCTSGQHVIVELKKYSVALSVETLHEQGTKYRTALSNLLDQQQRKDKDIIVVFVLGKPPRVPNRGRYSTDEEFIEYRFDSLPGRFVLYERLIGQAKYQYEEYLKASDKAKALDELLGTWGTELATEEPTCDVPAVEELPANAHSASNRIPIESSEQDAAAVS